MTSANMLTLQQILSAVLLVGGLMHGVEMLRAYPKGSVERVWSTGSAAFAVFLGLVCWLLATSQQTTLLALLAIAGLLAWIVIVLAFGRASGKAADPRVLYHAFVSLALIGTIGVQLALWQ